RDLVNFHAAQQPAGRGHGGGQQIVLAVFRTGLVKLDAQRLHEVDVPREQLAAARVRELEVVWVTRLVVGRGVLVVNVDRVKTVFADKVHDGVCKDVDLGLRVGER